jgi:hypothetical protein
MKITKEDLLKKIDQIDQKLMNLWLNENSDINDDDIWEMFVILLESRVELLGICLHAGVPLTRQICLPDWLERLTDARKEMRLRELKKLANKKSQGEKYRLYENVAELLKDSNK